MRDYCDAQAGFWLNSKFWSKFSSLPLTPKYPPPPRLCKTSDLGWPKFTPKYPPPLWKTSDLGWPKFTPKYPPPLWKTSDLGWPKFTPKYPPPIMENFRFWMTKVYSKIPPPPPMENFRFGMTKVYSEIPPHIKLQIWDDQSLLRNTPPPMENFRFGMTKVYSEIPPPPLWKTSDLGWPKFTPKYPPQPKIVREFKSKIFRIPRVTICGDFIQPG